MEIIRQGDLYRLNKIKQFDCPTCGCIFLADKNEYEYSGMQYNKTYWKCKCPTCGNWTYVEE